MIAELHALGIDTRGQTAGEIRTTCPECSPSRKKSNERCLAVNLDDGVYCCHHCSWAGKAKAGRDGYGSPEQRPAYRKPEYEPGRGEADIRLVRWLVEERGLTADVIERARVEYRRVRMRKDDDGEVGAAAFPYFRDGQVVNVKYRDGRKRFRMEWGAELTLYGLDDIAQGEPLYWVEGEIDKLSLAVAGEWRAVSVPNGAPALNARNYAKHFEYLGVEQARLTLAERHVIAVDADEPGRALAAELIRRLGPERCWTVTWPEGCKDANDVLRQRGPDELRAALAAAAPVPVEGLTVAAEHLNDILDLWEHGLPGGATSGVPALNERYTVKPGQFTVVTGIPGRGKSAFIDWLCVDLAKRHGWRFAIFSPENYPLARHAASLMAIWAGMPFTAGPQVRLPKEEVADGAAWLSEHFVHILPPEDHDGAYTVAAILDLARVAVYRQGIKGLVIDPWNEIDHARPANLTETEHISRCLTQVRRFARLYGVHVWLVAHPMKLQRDSSGEYPVPSLYDISGSAHWRNKADMGVVVHRDVGLEDGNIQVHIQKVRFRECGKLGEVPLYFDLPTGRFREVPWSVPF